MAMPGGGPMGGMGGPMGGPSPQQQQMIHQQMVAQQQAQAQAQAQQQQQQQQQMGMHPQGMSPMMGGGGPPGPHPSSVQMMGGGGGGPPHPGQQMGPGGPPMPGQPPHPGHMMNPGGGPGGGGGGPPQPHPGQQQQQHPPQQQQQQQPHPPQQGQMGPADQARLDNISKAKSLVIPIKDNLSSVLRTAAHAIYANNMVDSGSKPVEYDVSRFDRCVEEFFSLCDQMEIHLKTSIECINQGMSSSRYLPAPITLNKMDGSLTYPQYVNVIKGQIAYAKEIHGTLSDAAQKLSE